MVVTSMTTISYFSLELSSKKSPILQRHQKPQKGLRSEPKRSWQNWEQICSGTLNLTATSHFLSVRHNFEHAIANSTTAVFPSKCSVAPKEDFCNKAVSEAASSFLPLRGSSRRVPHAPVGCCSCKDLVSVSLRRRHLWRQ